jgi:hypothetical protein
VIGLLGTLIGSAQAVRRQEGRADTAARMRPTPHAP